MIIPWMVFWQSIVFVCQLPNSAMPLFIFAEWDDKEEGKEALQQWEDDWDDDDVNDDFSLQLKKELESNSEKS